MYGWIDKLVGGSVGVCGWIDELMCDGWEDGLVYE